MTDKNDIKRLTESYFKGLTTEEEEQQLRHFFAQSADDDGFEEERKFFQLFEEDEPVEDVVPADLVRHLEQQIDAWNTIERQTSRKARRISLRWITGIAAMLVVAFVIAYSSLRENRQVAQLTPQDTYDNPQDAYEEAQRALSIFSKAINDGIDKLNN